MVLNMNISIKMRLQTENIRMIIIQTSLRLMEHNIMIITVLIKMNPINRIIPNELGKTSL